MTLSVSTRRNDYTGNGSTSSFAYSFKINDDDDLTVLVRNPTTDAVTTLVKTTDYTVSGVGLAAGGNIALVNSAQAWLDGDGDLITGWKLTILGSASNVQSTSVRNQGRSTRARTKTPSTRSSCSSSNCRKRSTVASRSRRTRPQAGSMSRSTTRSRHQGSSP